MGLGALLSGGQSSRSRASAGKSSQSTARNKDGSDKAASQVELEGGNLLGFASSTTYVYSGDKAEKAESTSVSQPGKGDDQEEDIGPPGEDD